MVMADAAMIERVVSMDVGEAAAACYGVRAPAAARSGVERVEMPSSRDIEGMGGPGRFWYEAA